MDANHNDDPASEESNPEMVQVNVDLGRGSLIEKIAVF